VTVVLPTLTIATYFGFFAADQYAAETRFAVRSATTTQAPNDLLGLISVAPAATVADAYVLIDFVRSRQILDRLQTEIDYKAMFSRPEADNWARLDTALPMEKVIPYWRRMVSIGFDTTSQIMTLQTRAFRPDDALHLANAILRQSEQLINDLSARARADGPCAWPSRSSRSRKRACVSRASRSEHSARSVKRSTHARRRRRASRSSRLCRAS
jgi:capsular polysaccharide transport system permease protein